MGFPVEVLKTLSILSGHLASRFPLCPSVDADGDVEEPHVGPARLLQGGPDGVHDAGAARHLHVGNGSAPDVVGPENRLHFLHVGG